MRQPPKFFLLVIAPIMIAANAMGGSMSKAREHANVIMKLNPMRGHTALGVIAERSNDMVAAEKEFRTAITVYPDSVAPYNILAGFYRRQKRVGEALAMYKKVIALDPKNESARKGIDSLKAQSR